jgi:hypothetical protein
MGDKAASDKALERANVLSKVDRHLDGLRHLRRPRLLLFNGDAGPRLIKVTVHRRGASGVGLFGAKHYGLVAAAFTTAYGLRDPVRRCDGRGGFRRYPANPVERSGALPLATGDGV